MTDSKTVQEPTSISDYLRILDDRMEEDGVQNAWYDKLRTKATQGTQILENCTPATFQKIQEEFRNRVRTEELKAWYSSPENDSLFQGTSISSLTIPCELTEPLEIDSITILEHAVADYYIELHDRYEETVRNSVLEDVEDWIRDGLFYGICLSSKVVSQAFSLSVRAEDVILKVGGYNVDPHQIITYPTEIRAEYFATVAKNLECFDGIELSREEVESSLILADISKPKIEKYKSRIILAPFRCNEIAAVMAKRVKDLIIEKTQGRISPPSLNILIFDTDTPYTYHHLIGCNGHAGMPILPGLTIMGSSGTIDAFKWLYCYRVSLISQKIQKSSLYSEAHRKFIPFVYYGVLVPRDAEILLDMSSLDKLRYRGNLSPQMEFNYLVPSLAEYITNDNMSDFQQELVNRLK